MRETSPFEVLGLTARGDLTDDDVRAAWRRIATATHPDRTDGGDPVRYAQAADAYARLRTQWDRGEVLADQQPPSGGAARSRRVARPGGVPRPGGAARARPRMRAGILLLRAAAAAAVCWSAYVTAGWVPATAGVMTGAVTWLVLTGRRDLPARAS